MNYVATMQAIAAAAAPRRVGTDAMSPLFAQLLPVAFGDAEIVDGSAALRAARRTKTAEEVVAIRAAVQVAEVALAAAAGALEPGMGERELSGAFMDAMATHGVTTPARQDVVRVTTPGAGGVVRAGDLVAFQAGVVAGGYAGEVGRTHLAGDAEPSSAVRDLHRRGDALSARLIDACRPGAPASGLLDAYAAAGEPLPSIPVGRGLGLGFDDPVVVADLPTTAAAERLDPGVVLVVSTFVSDDRAGAIITHQPVLVTDDGPELLARAPHWTPERTGAHP